MEVINPTLPSEKVHWYLPGNIRNTFGDRLSQIHVMHRDQLSSTVMVTDENADWALERVYAPFGADTEWENASAINPLPEDIGFIGERKDALSGLHYLNARYYDPKLRIFIQPDWFEVTEAGVGTNRYSYSFNDPVNGMDLGGNLVIFVDGTESDGAWREDNVSNPNDLFSQVERTYGETPVSLGNTGMGNNQRSLTIAARSLREEVLEAISDGDQQIVVIGHSHGVNVAKFASQMRGVQIDEIVGLGGPVRSDIRMNADRVGSYINVFSNNDAIQQYGGKDGSFLGARTAGVSAGRIDPQATKNVDASVVTRSHGTTIFGETVTRNVPVGHFSGAATIHGPQVWEQHVEPALDD